MSGTAPGATPSDLTIGALAAAAPGRPVRAYPALLSTDADALAWARGGAPTGAVVVAGYQASPRGRAGRMWTVDAERSLAFSMVVRPDLEADREGWLYVVAASAVADVVGGGAAVRWPDEVVVDEHERGAVGVQTELAHDRVRWGVLGILVRQAQRPRAPLVAAVAAAVESRLAAPPDAVLDDYRARCPTLGLRVAARLLPLGPAAPVVEGRAADVLADGALVVETGEGRRVAVRPQNLGFLDPLD